MGLGMGNLILGALGIGSDLLSPYTSAKASTYATKELLNNLGDYQALANAVDPPTGKAYATKNKNTGEMEWHKPIGTLQGTLKAFGSGDPDQYWTDQMAQNSQNAATSLKQDSALKSILSAVLPWQK